MTAPPLRSNQELFEYLVELADRLQSEGETELANAVQAASQFEIGSQTEFLAEAQGALRRVRLSNISALNHEQSSRLLDVLQQIQVAFIKIGGA